MEHLMAVVRIFVGLALWMALGGAAFADPAACIKACETPAIACSDLHRGAKHVCIRDVRASCKGVPYAQLMGCVRKANTACTQTHNPAIAACDDTFKTCHKACVGDAPIKSGYWCRAEADLTGEVTRKTGYCDVAQSADGLAACLKQFEFPAPAGSTLMMECQPL